MFIEDELARHIATKGIGIFYQIINPDSYYNLPNKRKVVENDIDNLEFTLRKEVFENGK